MVYEELEVSLQGLSLQLTSLSVFAQKFCVSFQSANNSLFIESDTAAEGTEDQSAATLKHQGYSEVFQKMIHESTQSQAESIHQPQVEVSESSKKLPKAGSSTSVPPPSDERLEYDDQWQLWRTMIYDYDTS